MQKIKPGSCAQGTLSSGPARKLNLPKAHFMLAGLSEAASRANTPIWPLSLQMSFLASSTTTSRSGWLVSPPLANSSGSQPR